MTAHTVGGPDMGTPFVAFSEALRAGGMHLNVTAAVPHPLQLETLCRAGYGSITLDVQHGAFDEAGVFDGIGVAAACGVPAFVRAGLDQLGFMARCLDAGAAGLLAPMINDAAQARALVAATRYPPLGERSWGPVRALPRAGLTATQFLAQANRGSIVLAMVETREALSQLDAIAATPGLDGLFVGPLDLAISLAGGAHCDPTRPEVLDAMQQVAAACARHGKLAGAYAADAAAARQCADWGYRFLAVALDVPLLAAAARDRLALMSAAVQAGT